MIIIGLTGNIGTGKSTVSRMLSELGAAVINADEVGHELLRPYTEVWREVVQAFGREILDPADRIDRGKLGRLVFGDPEALKKLDQIMHPQIRRVVEKRLEELRQEGTEVAVLEVPLLFEAGWESLTSQVWVTFAPEDVVIRRLRERSGLSEEQVRARLRAQLPTEGMKKHADVLINTDCDLAQVQAQVKVAWRELIHPGSEELKRRIKRILAGREKRRITTPGLAPAAVLVPIFEKEGQHYILFIERTQSVEYHKGEISFPGGVKERGESALNAALRESYEEIGLHPEDAEVLGELDEEQTLTSNFVVFPFVAFIPFPYEFRVSRGEVQKLIPVPFSALRDPKNLEEKPIVQDGQEHLTYFYHVEGQVIWGATARILKKFLDLVFRSGLRVGS